MQPIRHRSFSIYGNQVMLPQTRIVARGSKNVSDFYYKNVDTNASYVFRGSDPLNSAPSDEKDVRLH